MADGEVKIELELDDSKAISQAGKSGDEIGKSVSKGLESSGKAARNAESEIAKAMDGAAESASSSFKSVESDASKTFGSVKSTASADGKSAGEGFSSGFESKAKVSGVKSDVESETGKAKGVAGSNGDSAGSAFGDEFVSAAKKALGALTAVLTAEKIAGAIGDVLSQSVEVANDFGEDMGKLEVAFTQQGFSVGTANEAYRDFVGILGETDQSVEAVNHLAQLTDSEEELSAWTDIAAGVYAQFGDSLPLEGLTEAVNETAKVAKVTGPLADALNWASLSAEEWSESLSGNAEAQEAFNQSIASGENVEDSFTAALAAAGDEQERATLLTNALAAAYTESGQAYQETNAAVVEYRRAQSDLHAEMNNLGQTVMPLASMFRFGLAGALGVVAETMENMDLAGFIEAGDFAGAGAEIASGVVFMLESLVEQVPAFVDMGLQFAIGLITGIVEALPGLASTLVVAVIGMVPVLIDAAISLVIALVDALPTIIESLVAAIPTIVTALVEALITGLPLLIEGFIELFVALTEALPQIISALVAATPTIITAIVTALIGAMPELIDGFIQIFMAFVQALPVIIVNIVAMIPQIIAAIISAISQLGGQLFNAAVSAFSQFVSGIGSKIGEIASMVSQIPGMIVSALGNVGGLLVDAGRSIIDGFLGGLKSAWSNVTGFIGGIGDWIVNHKGPRDYDLRLLIPAGKWIMTGLSTGLEEGLPQLEDTLDEVTAKVEHGINPGTGAWDTVIDTGEGIARGLMVGFDRVNPAGSIVESLATILAMSGAMRGGDVITNNIDRGMTIYGDVRSPDEIFMAARREQMHGLAGQYGY